MDANSQPGTMRAFAFTALAAILLWGAFLRFSHIGDQSLWIDEAFSWCHAQAIAQHGRPLLDHGAMSWSHPVPHYAMAAALAAAGPNPAAARLPAALAGTIAIAVLYLFTRRLGSPTFPALVTTFAFAFLTFEVTCCRQARYYSVLQLATLLACLSVLAAHDRPTPRRIITAGVCLLAALLSHPSGLMLAVFAGTLWFSAARPTERPARRGMAIALLLAVAVALLLPGNASLLRALGHLGWYPERWGNYAHVLGGQFGWTLLPIATGLVLAFIRPNPAARATAVMVIAYFIHLCVGSPLSHLRYITPLLPFLAALGAWGAAECLSLIRTRAPSWATPCVATLFAASLISADLSLKPYQTYYLGPTAPQPDWRAGYRWVAQDHAIPAVLRIASNFPELQQAYAPASSRFYLPVNLTGKTGGERPTALYTSAETVQNLRQLKALGQGYVLMDDLGLVRTVPTDVRNALLAQRPATIINGPFRVYVWRIQDLRR